jgi:hypothetical protein
MLDGAVFAHKTASSQPTKEVAGFRPAPVESAAEFETFLTDFNCREPSVRGSTSPVSMVA